MCIGPQLSMIFIFLVTWCSYYLHFLYILDLGSSPTAIFGILLFRHSVYLSWARGRAQAWPGRLPGGGNRGMGSPCKVYAPYMDAYTCINMFLFIYMNIHIYLWIIYCLIWSHISFMLSYRSLRSPMGFRSPVSTVVRGFSCLAGTSLAPTDPEIQGYRCLVSGTEA